MSARLRYAARFIIPAVWLGLIIAIDLIEAPLKFQAPGITIPLGLGIGRLVFFAMNITELVLAILWLLAVLRPKLPRYDYFLLGGILLVYLVKVAVIRPLLNARTDAVLAGLDEGGSLTHYFYIGADVVLFVLLIWWLARQIRTLPLPAAFTAGRPDELAPVHAESLVDAGAESDASTAATDQPKGSTTP